MGKLLPKVGIFTLQGLELGQHGGILGPQVRQLGDDLVQSIITG